VTPEPLRVLFIHGLEGSPQGAKARFLAQRFDATTPAMDTSDFPGCVRLQARHVHEFHPDVVVGSSFGGAVALALVRDGTWRGPTVLLAPAVRHCGVPAEVPAGIAVTIVHGTADDVVDISASRTLARTGSPGLVELLEVSDGHRLQSLLDDGWLASIVRDTAARASAGGRPGVP
jgi:predicted esterase